MYNMLFFYKNLKINSLVNLKKGICLDYLEKLDYFN